MSDPLHFNQTAPIALPLPLLLAAPLFGLVSILLLIAGLPDILGNRWNTELIAAIHIYTLGFLGCSMFGAVLQMLPVLSGRPPLRHRLLIRLLQAALFGGASLFAFGMHSGTSSAMQAALFLLALAVILFLALAIRQFHTREWRDSLRGMGFALAGLAVAATLGLTLLSGWSFNGIPVARQLTDLHAGWALLAWVAPLVFAVSLEVVPMFQYTKALPRFVPYLPAALIAGMALASFDTTRTAGMVLLGASTSSFALAVLYLQWTRPFGQSDATLQLFRIGMLSLLLAVLFQSLGELSMMAVSTSRMLATFLFLVGFAGSCVIAMLLKIVPFLVRLHLQREMWNAGLPARTLPAFNKLVPAFVDDWVWPMQASGVAVFTLGVLAGKTAVILLGLVATGATMLICLVGTWQVGHTGRRFYQAMQPEPHTRGLT